MAEPTISRSARGPTGGPSAAPVQSGYAARSVDLKALHRGELLAAASAPAILAWIIVRGHALAWPRGELTAVVAVAATVLTLVRGLIDRPGSPTGEISVDSGWWVATVGGLLILAGSIWRSQEGARRRKPPGVL